MARKPHVDFNYAPPEEAGMVDIKAALIENPNFRGIGGHGIQEHGRHGSHSQISIGVGGITFNFRNILETA